MKISHEQGRIIGLIFKLLPIYENDGFENYSRALSKTIIDLSGEDENKALERVIKTLKGLKKIGRDVTHAELKSAILSCTSLIRNKYYES